MQVLRVSYGSPDAATTFVRSLRETGFAVVADHPVAADLIREVYEEWEDFFQSEDKMRYVFDPKLQAGYFPFKTENAKGYSKKDLKEFFHLYPWNELPEGLSRRTLELREELIRVATTLLRWVDEGSPPEIRRQFSMPLMDMIEGSQENLLRILHYPPLTGGEEEGAIRAAAHEDINLITVLTAATTPGLEVLDTLGRWHQVSCDPGNLVINAGDMLQMASQGYFRSTTHRVVNPRGEAAQTSRYSMPLFLHPRRDVRLSERHTAWSYLEERLNELGLKNAGKNDPGLARSGSSSGATGAAI